MLSHKKIWAAIDGIARESGLTASGLAKKAGLDPTSFNKSKRIGSGGKLRWPSTESVYKILKVLNKDLSFFSSLVEPDSFSEINIIGSIKNNAQGFCETIEESEWEKIAFPRSFSKDTVAIKISGYSLEPVYRNGDVLVISKNEDILCEGDRIAIKTTNDELLIKTFSKKDDKNLTIKSLREEKNPVKIPTEEVDWIAKIMWASQ